MQRFIWSLSRHVLKYRVRSRAIIGTLLLAFHALTWSVTEPSFGSDQAFSISKEALGLEASGQPEVDVERFEPLWASFHGGPVDYSPDGQWLAVGGVGNVYILHVESQQVVAQLFGHAGNVLAVKWSRDGRYLASGASLPDTAIRIWDMESGAVRRTLPGANTHSMAWSPDGRYLAFANFTGGHAIFEVETGRRHLEGVTQGGSALAWSPDGRYIAIGLFGEQGVRLYEASTGRRVRDLDGLGGYKRDIAWSMDGRLLAACSQGYDIGVWEVGTGTQVRRLTHEGGPTSVAWSRDGRYLASGAGSIKLWRTDTWALVRTMSRAGGLPNAYVAWNADGSRLASGGSGLVNLWDVETGTSTTVLEGHRNEVQFVSWRPDGSVIASATNASPRNDGISLKLWDRETGTAIWTCEGDSCIVISFEWSPDGRYIAMAGLDLVIIEAETGEEVGRIEMPGGGVTWSPNGRYLAFVSSRHPNTIFISDFETGEGITITPEGTQFVTSIAWSPDGNYLASSVYNYNPDSTIKIWQVGTWQLVTTLTGLLRDGVRSVTWSPDSRYVAAVEGRGIIRIWELATRQVIRSIGQSGPIMSVMWSPDGRYLAAGVLPPTLGVKIWEASTGNLIRTLLGHAGNLITSVRWSPDGRYLASTSDDRTIRVWGEISDE